ncbi:MAG: homoserine kinase [Gammaproteobacteria bacterium]|nr:homoserine kinase [Gammaproteobacteria bacterium]
MSVFTTVERAQLAQFLKRYELGVARDFRPIYAGITNTNYYLDTDHDRYVLTLYEHHSDDELDYILELQQHLSGQGVACPAPVADRRGDKYSTLNNRPAAINRRMPGEVEASPDDMHCALVGAELARFHLAGRDFGKIRPNPRGVEWLLAAGDMLETELSRNDRLLIASTLRDFRDFDLNSLAQGAIHADLFHDNALFHNDTLGGIIDFDYACYDCLVLDLAVVLNDWCIDAGGGLQAMRVAAVLDAYQQLRRLDRAELQALPMMLRFAALRFWVSRLYDKTYPLSGELTFVKDPQFFRNLLLLRDRQAGQLQQLFLPHDMG